LHDLPFPALPQLTDTLSSWGIDGMEPGHSLFHGDLLAREPDTAFAEELTARWIDL
jgi:hypothetical protein